MCVQWLKFDIIVYLNKISKKKIRLLLVLILIVYNN